LQHNDERVLAGKEHVHVADNAVVCNQQQAKPQERRVLQQDVKDDAPDVDGTATRAAVRASRVPARSIFIKFGTNVMLFPFHIFKFPIFII
jgi:hypothetical protein